ncbi:MAG: sensor histidine kinase, partial [Anaerolineales bacterium]
TGLGIPPDDLPHLFNRFHRGRNAAAYPGSGLGLAIVRAILAQHNGTVQVESTAGGTIFSLTLPRVSPAHLPPPPAGF